MEQPTSTIQVTYQIDRLDRIETVGGAWVQFADENNGSSAVTTVVGHRLWEFVADATTQQVYRDLIVRVREGRVVAFSYRCDSPTLRRFMKMTMSPGPRAAVAFDSRVVKLEPRPAPAWNDRANARTGDLLRVCGWCKRVAVADEWLEVELAVERLGLMTGKLSSGITHGMCPACFARVMAETEAA